MPSSPTAHFQRYNCSRSWSQAGVMLKELHNLGIELKAQTKHDDNAELCWSHNMM